MACLINSDTSDGLKFTSDTSGEIKLQSAGADIVSVTANGMAVDTSTLYVNATNNRVGIGTSSPATTLTVTGSFANGLEIYKNGVDSTSSARLFFNSDTNTTAVYNANGNFIISTGATVGSSSGTERMRIDSSGALHVKCTASQQSVTSNARGFTSADYGIFANYNDVVLICNRTNSTGNCIQLRYNGGVVGNIITNTSSTTYSTSSDYRIKENNVDITDGIIRVKQLNPYRFNFIAEPDVTVDGFFAHEVQSVVPEAISGTKDAMRTEEYEVTPAVLDDDGNVVTEAVMGTREVPDYQGIDQSKLVPLLTAALQEAITKIEDLETRIQALENA